MHCWDAHIHACMLKDVLLLSTPWTVARQASLSMRFPKQEDWTRLPCPLLGYLPDPGIKPASPELAGECFSTVPSGHLRMHIYISPNVTIWTHIGNQLGLDENCWFIFYRFIENHIPDKCDFWRQPSYLFPDLMDFSAFPWKHVSRNWARETIPEWRKGCGTGWVRTIQTMLLFFYWSVMGMSFLSPGLSFFSWWMVYPEGLPRSHSSPFLPLCASLLQPGHFTFVSSFLL